MEVHELFCDCFRLNRPRARTHAFPLSSAQTPQNCKPAFWPRLHPGFNWLLQSSANLCMVAVGLPHLVCVCSRIRGCFCVRLTGAKNPLGPLRPCHPSVSLNLSSILTRQLRAILQILVTPGRCLLFSLASATLASSSFPLTSPPPSSDHLPFVSNSSGQLNTSATPLLRRLHPRISFV